MVQKVGKTSYTIFLCGITVTSIFLFQTTYSNQDACQYRGKIELCKNTKSPRAIEDFVCIFGSEEKVIYQIVLDEKFSKIDNEIDSYLTSIEKNKNEYFGIDASKTLVEGVDDMFRMFATHGYFWKKFKKECNSEIITDTISCLNEEKTSIIEAEKYLTDSSNTCMNLANKKLEISKKVALNLLNLDKYQIRKDQMKLYVQKERSKYQDLLDGMMINLGYMERILHKWTAKIKTAYK